jgi:PKD repeat protein
VSKKGLGLGKVVNLAIALAIAVGTFAWLAPAQPALAWATQQSAEVLCAPDGEALIEVSFTNSEPAGAIWWMDVSATDLQTGKSISLGTVKGGETTTGVIHTGQSSLGNGQVKFHLVWTNQPCQGQDDRWASYSAITCQLPNNPPVCTLNANPNSGYSPLDVHFTATASDPDGDELSYSWDFNDGDTAQGSLERNHTYTQVGNYLAVFTVSDGEDQVVCTADISVGEVPPPPPPPPAEEPTCTLTLTVLDRESRFVRADVTWSGGFATDHPLFWGDKSKTLFFGESGSGRGQKQYSVGTYKLTFRVEGPGGVAVCKDAVVFEEVEEYPVPGIQVFVVGAANPNYVFEGYDWKCWDHKNNCPMEGCMPRWGINRFCPANEAEGTGECPLHPTAAIAGLSRPVDQILQDGTMEPKEEDHWTLVVVWTPEGWKILGLVRLVTPDPNITQYPPIYWWVEDWANPEVTPSSYNHQFYHLIRPADFPLIGLG